MVDYLSLFQRYFLKLFLICIGFCGHMAMAYALPTIYDARSFGDIQHTRFVVDISEKLTPNIIYLENPHRIVIELPEVKYQFDDIRSASGLGLIETLRYGLLLGGKSRFILDLTQEAEIAHIAMQEKNSQGIAQLVIDLKNVSSQRFASLVAQSKKAITSEAKSTPAAPSLLPERNQNDNRFIVVLDAGHGGIDSGAVGKKGTKEKKVVLAVTQSLAQKLKSHPFVEVHMTRDRDIFIPLTKRITMAREKKADLFISIHADAFQESYVNGATVYTLSKTASDRQAGIIARAENRSDIVAGVDLDEQPSPVSSILIDLMVRETKAFSTLFAGISLKNMDNVTRLHSKKPKSANFTVLRAPDIPSVLIELGYISNPNDEGKLNQESWRQNMAQKIADAIIHYGKTTGQIQ